MWIQISRGNRLTSSVRLPIHDADFGWGGRCSWNLAESHRRSKFRSLVPSAGDEDTSAMGIPDPARARCGEKRPLLSRAAPCRACARRKMILCGVDPGPLSDGELSALPSTPPPSPVPGTGSEIPVPDAGALEMKGSPSATGMCGLCEFRKKIHLNRRLRRNSGVPAPPPGSSMPVPSLDDMSRLEMEQKPRTRARHGKKRPLSVEQERGYRECDVGKKLMRHKWDGLRHKWAGLPGLLLEMEMSGFGAAAGGHDLLKMPGFEMPGFGAAAGGHDLLKMPCFEMPGFGAAAGGRDLLKMPGFGADLLEMSGFGAAAGGRDLLKMPCFEMPGFGAAAGGLDLLKMPGFGADLLEMSGFGAAAGGRDLLEMPGFGAAVCAASEELMLALRKANAKFAPPQGVQKPSSSAAARVDVLHEKLAQMTKVLTKGAQKPSSSPAARVDVLHEKLAQMTKVLTMILHEGSVLLVSTKLMRLLCPDAGSSAAAEDDLDGNNWRLVEEAIDNLVYHTGEGMQDIAKTVIPKVFSKEILYDLIMECVGRYTKLLGDDKGKLTKEKYEQYQKQLDLMVNLTTVYDNDPENFSKIMKLMCKIGRCGPLPSEVIDDISPGLDPTTMEGLYNGMLALLHNVDRASSCSYQSFL